MSTYTTELRYVCETLAGKTESVGYNDIDSVIAAARPLLFNFDYPIFDSAYKGVLETKIIMHYYTRELCAETVGLWKLFLRRKLNEIMPYYNKLYESETIKYNPLYDMELSTMHSKANTEKRSGDNTDKTNYSTISNMNGEEHIDDGYTDRDLYSDTPQGALTGVENEDYLTNARKNTHNGDEDKTYGESKKGVGITNKDVIYNENSNNTEQYIERVTGSNGGQSYSSKIIEYRKTLLNIDEMIIEELSDLFFNLW